MSPRAARSVTDSRAAEGRALTARLRTTLRTRWGGAGRRSCVLVLGNGLNLQAARVAGTPKDDWNRALEALWKEAGGSPGDFNHSDSNALKWTALLQQYARAARRTPAGVERLLRASLARRLARMKVAGAGRSLYSAVLAAGFANIVSFNIDRRLVQGVRASQLVEGELRRSFLSRHLRVRRRDGDETSIWFPYGCATDPHSIAVGHAGYAERLMHLEDYREGAMKRWYDWDASYSGYELRPPNEVYWSMQAGVASWYDLFFVAPLVFVGASLPSDDWPLWWLLHQRARNFAPFERRDCPETFFLTSRSAAADHAHLLGGPGGIESVTFASYDSLWRFLLDAFK